jgi:hypothetical protein
MKCDICISKLSSAPCLSFIVETVFSLLSIRCRRNNDLPCVIRSILKDETATPAERPARLPS